MTTKEVIGLLNIEPKSRFQQYLKHCVSEVLALDDAINALCGIWDNNQESCEEAEKVLVDNNDVTLSEYAEYAMTELCNKTRIEIYHDIYKLINSDTNITDDYISIFKKRAVKLGEEIMRTTEEIIDNKPKFTFVEMLIDAEGYLEDCRKNNVKPDRTYTNGTNGSWVDFSKVNFLYTIDYVDFTERDWYLIK